MSNKRTTLTDEQLKQCARKLHQKGMEVTPTEVDDVIRSGLDKVRASLEQQGFTNLPQDDQDFIRWIKLSIMGK